MVSHALCGGIRGMLKVSPSPHCMDLVIWGLRLEVVSSNIYQEYRVLTAQLESLFLSSSTFTLQTLYFHLHPTLHTMSLLASLCQALETDEARGETDDEDGDDDDDDDGFGGKAEELGLGGAAFKGLMSGMKAREMLPGQGAPAGEVIGGEVLGIICERENTMSGWVHLPFFDLLS